VLGALVEARPAVDRHDRNAAPAARLDETGADETGGAGDE
jgi:hypothetical protein